MHTLVETLQRSGRFRLATFCTYDARSRTTRSFANAGWHQAQVQRAFALMNLRLPAYDPRAVATPIDRNLLLLRVIDGREAVTGTIEAYTGGMVPSFLTMILGRVAGGRHVAARPVVVRGEVVGVLTGYHRHAEPSAEQERVLTTCTAEIARWIGDAGLEAFGHGASAARPPGEPRPVPPVPAAPPGWDAGRQVGELSARQREIWALLAQGHSNAAIARHLGVSPRWIDNAVGQLYAALGVDTRDPAVNARVQATLLHLQKTC